MRELNVRRNTVLLAATLAINSCLFQLAAAVNSLTFVLITGIRGLLGLGPAIFLAASGLAALPAGRAMDRYGRRPVIVCGFLIAGAGCSLIALATRTDSPAQLIAGMVMTGAAGGVALLIRTAAGDMYPPERRARGIAYVLFGSVFGAILGPAVFSPLFAGKDVGAHALTLPWLAAGAIALVAGGVALLVRPDPKEIAEAIGTTDDAREPAAPLSEILRRPGVVPALVTALASFGVMVSVMNLTGFVVVEHHHHTQQDVFPIIGAHVLGMYALVLVIGPLIDRLGRGVSLWTGLVVMALSCIGLTWFGSVVATGVLLFGLGLGWSVSFVAATAQLADRAAPAERGKLLGFNDQLSALTGAGLALLGGYALDALGVAALAIGSTVLVLLPLIRLLRRDEAVGTIAPRRT
ncbi:MAG TPA: MFS transporter [Gaiellaceae bacterium]